MASKATDVIPPEILVCGYTDFPERPDPAAPRWAPIAMTLNLTSWRITGAHTPIYNPLIDKELERIFIGNPIYAGLDYYGRRIKATLHFPSSQLLIEALRDLRDNLLSALRRYWPAVRLPAAGSAAVRIPPVHYDYFCGTTYLSQRLGNSLSHQMTVFAKVNAASGQIEDCWFSRFSAFPDDSLRALFCGYNLTEDPRRVIDQIQTYYRIKANKAMINMFTDLVNNCRAYYG
jgi:hypothetical protein